jgi:hypothetical protein
MEQKAHHAEFGEHRDRQDSHTGNTARSLERFFPLGMKILMARSNAAAS